MNTTDLGVLIRLKRKEKGLNQKDFAAALNVSAAAVNKWENGKNYPDLQNLEAISALLDIPVTEMLGGKLPSPAQKPEADNITSEPDSRSPTQGEAPPALAMPSLPEVPVPQPADITESSDIAIPDIEDTGFAEITATAVPQPEKASEPSPSKEKRIRLKAAVPLLMLLLVGIIAVCQAAVGGQSKTPSFTVCASYYGSYEGENVYYGDYEGENVYYVIVEFESKPTSDDILDHEEIIREQYGHHFSEVNMIVIIYVQDYITYTETGFNNDTDVMGILLH